MRVVLAVTTEFTRHTDVRVVLAEASRSEDSGGRFPATCQPAGPPLGGT